MKVHAHLLAILIGSGLLFTPASGAREGVRTIQPAWTMPYQGQSIEVQASVLPIRQLIAIVQSQRGGSFVDVVG
ncbi:MAG: hypothetical protein ABW199_06515, partial [Caulobacterales bacterium]